MPLKIWVDKNQDGGCAAPQGKEEQKIVCHIGSKDGFVNDIVLIFREKKQKKSEYHTEMNSKVFFDWMENTNFKNIPTRSVIVLDSATYHTKLTEDIKTASSTFTKLKFAQWLVK